MLRLPISTQKCDCCVLPSRIWLLHSILYANEKFLHVCTSTITTDYSYTHTSTGETSHPHHNKTIQGAAPKREKIASSRLLQYIQHKHLKMADWGRNM
jgi:hypothetical protein